jgi:hypothetical protein
MRIALRAQTEHWTFHFDDEGFCRSVVATPAQDGGLVIRPLTREAHDCLGAQFLGVVDAGVPGGVSARPRPCASMLLGYVDADSRIRLLRTGPIVGFEALGTTRASKTDAVATVGPDM